MRLGNQTGIVDPSLALANENALINNLNQYTGILAPQTGAGANGSDTTTDTLATIVIPPNLLAAAGDTLQLRGWGSTGATTATKTVGISLVQGTTTTSITGNNALNNGKWDINVEIFYSVTPNLTYFGTVNLGGTLTTSQNTSTISPSSAITALLTGATNTAAASDVVSNFFRGMIIK